MTGLSDAVSSASAPLASLTVSVTSTAHCFQPRASTDPPAEQILFSLASASVVSNACNISLEQGDRVGINQTAYYDAAGAFDFNATHIIGDRLGIYVQQSCRSTYQTIVDICVLQRSFWGGWSHIDGTNFSMSNLLYPANPLPLLAASGDLATIHGSSLLSRDTSSRETTLLSMEITASSLAHDPSFTSQSSGSGRFTPSLSTQSAEPSLTRHPSQSSNSGGSTPKFTDSTGSSHITDTDIAGHTKKSDVSVDLIGKYSGTATGQFPRATGFGSATSAKTDSSVLDYNLSLSVATKSSQKRYTGADSVKTASTRMNSDSASTQITPTALPPTMGTDSKKESIKAPSASLTSMTIQSSADYLLGTSITFKPYNEGNPPPGPITLAASIKSTKRGEGGYGGIIPTIGPTTVVPDYSILGAFDSGESSTTISASNGAFLIYSMQTFSDLISLTGVAPMLVWTTVDETESDGHHTVFVGGIWVGPGGRYWGPPGIPKIEIGGLGGPDPFPIKPPCIWPFCSGEESNNGGGGGDPGGDPPDPEEEEEEEEEQTETAGEEEKTKTANDQTQSQEQKSEQRSEKTEPQTVTDGSFSRTAQSTASVITHFNRLTTSTPISTLSSMYTSTISMSSRLSSSYTISSGATMTLPDQGYVYQGLDVADARALSVSIQGFLSQYCIPSGPLWAPTDSVESVDAVEATQSYSFDLAISAAGGSLRACALTGAPLSYSGPERTLSSSSKVVTPTTSVTLIPTPPAPIPSLAVVMYRQDYCGDAYSGCEHNIDVYDILPGELTIFNPCSGQDTDIHYPLDGTVTNNDPNDYPIVFGTFTTHGIQGVSYAGSNLHVGVLSLPQGPVRCLAALLPTTSCMDSSTSLEEDDRTAIAYCLW
ncbi:hypothetical protein MMC21_008289 [Puttea exsequens]|nr:hypothetical protein [Puttea exsequens]